MAEVYGNSEFDPLFPAAQEVNQLHQEQGKAITASLSRLANLSIPVLGQTAKPESIEATLQDVLAHGETIKFFAETFANANSLSQAEFDQKLINWAFLVPGLREKFDELPENVRTCVDKFRMVDLSKEDGRSAVDGFKIPPSASVSRKTEVLRKGWQEQMKLDGGKKFPDIVENDGSPVVYVEKYVFENWGETVKNTPAVTFIPKSVVGVQNIVKYAKSVNKKVRCAGYRHTWTSLFSGDDEILISLLPLDTATDLPSIEGAFNPGAGLLQQIELLPNTSPDTNLCKIGTATTNDQFREWCLSPHGGNTKWTLPLNVIMVEITFGGSISPICHGAGIKHGTLSDLVAEVEFVDPNGNLHTVSDPELLKTAAGAFGLLGVVTAYTLRLDKMTYAAMRPFRSPIELAIPPPQEYIVAAKAGDKKFKWIKDLVAPYTQAAIDKATADFIHRAENDYYSEWFWFPLQRDVWVNTWDNNGLEAESKDIPDAFQVFLQWIQEWLGQQLNNWSVWQAMPGELQAKLLGFLTLLQLPNVTGNDKTLTTQLMNALHFRRGIQNMQVYDMEWEIPISAVKGTPATSSTPAKVANGTKKGKEPEVAPVESAAGTMAPTTKRDWSITQKAWWDAILLMHEEPAQVRVALEMRIMGSSQIHLAPQLNNTLGTASIEVLTTLNTQPRDWYAFCQKLTDKWLSYIDASTGKKLHSRPHWCKQWSFLKLPNEHGAPIKAVDWMRTVGYKKEIVLFKEGLSKIAEGKGFTVQDLRDRFGDALLESIIWGAPDPVEQIVKSKDVSRGIINKIKNWFRKLLS